MILFLTLLSGLCWTIVYLELIRVGFKDKTYGMPFVALALNIAWEAIYSYLGLKNDITSIQNWIVLIWFLLDVVIVYTYLRYGRKEFSKKVDESCFIPWTVIIFIMSFAVQYAFLVQFDNYGAWYSAFIQNLIMSLLFINMAVNRGNSKGQNLTIAISKWIGTLAPTILYGVIYGNFLVLILGIFCFVFDVIYIYYLKVIIKTPFNRSKSSNILNLYNNKFQG